MVSVTGLTNSQAVSGSLYTITSTATATAGFASGQFQYNANSNVVSVVNASAQRVVITPVSASVATGETTTNTSYVNLATVGPTVTVFTGTRALITIDAFSSNSGAGNAGWIALTVTGATTLVAADGNGTAYTSPSANYAVPMCRSFMITGLTAGLNTFSVQYRTSAGTATFTNRDITVIGLP